VRYIVPGWIERGSPAASTRRSATSCCFGVKCELSGDAPGGRRGVLIGNRNTAAIFTSGIAA
jgi:hypothetical protein